MLIRCKIERKGGSEISMDAETYHFKPEQSVMGYPHVCFVRDDAHVARFLSIPEGYELVRVAESVTALNEKAIGDPKPTQADADAVKAAVVANEPASDPDPTPEPAPAPEIDPLSLVLTDAEAATDDQVRAAFQAMFGRKANHNALRATIIDRIQAEAAKAAKAVTGE